VPRFIGEEGREVFESGCGLRLLWRCVPEHPLCVGGDTEGVEMRWLLSWGDIHRAQERLKEYQESMWEAIEAYGNNPSALRRKPLKNIVAPDDTVDYGLFDTKEAAEKMLSSSIQAMSLFAKSTSPNDFTTLLSERATLLSSPTPPLPLAVQTSFISPSSLQATLIHHSLLSLFFRTLSLQRHFATLHGYLLCGNGLFVSRLQQILFDDVDSEDGRMGGRPGLGLGVRGLREGERWPPHGGKVTLILRGLLEDCVDSEEELKEISFAFRELSDEHLERVNNPLSTSQSA
jgi:Gamma tubulin complex component C-terminal